MDVRCGPSVVETYLNRRQRYLAALWCRVGSEAEDVLHDAAEELLLRERAGLPVSWRIALRAHARRLGESRRRVDVGLPLHLRDAACLAETVARRRKLAMAQRVLTQAELDLLLQEYESAPVATMAQIRVARRKLRRARQ